MWIQDVTLFIKMPLDAQKVEEAEEGNAYLRRAKWAKLFWVEAQGSFLNSGERHSIESQKW